SQSDIIDYLKSKGLNPGKNIVSIIMKAITDAGFDLITVKNGRYNSYYIPSDFFDMTEARLLADAVVSATFITQNKTEMLLTKGNTAQLYQKLSVNQVGMKNKLCKRN
ncbi:MAG: hypothetical protein IJX24_07620, partial [Oscillospiraceae bacterium]|nr:hypothetical protein [Oscillospiraceae bacterium]